MSTTNESTSRLSENEQALQWQNEFLVERLTELELQLENEGWQVLTGGMDRELSRDALRTINRLARLNWLKNPLIQRGVNVQSYYVFGQGLEITANDDEINDMVQKFLDDAKNQTELTSHQALLLKEAELTLFGNLFFVFFVNAKTGHIRVRTVPVDEIDEILTNPEDAKDPWWYKRTYEERGLDGKASTKTVYYRDWRYEGSERPTSGEISPAPMFHVKVGCLSDMRFGVSEVYAALDWARAYKNFLEDWSTIVRAYSRFAWQVNVQTKAGMVAARSKLRTTVSDGVAETNPSPVTGSSFIGTPGTNIQPIRTAGATTSAEDGRRLLLMVAASAGLPESFFGDVSVGTLATARSLDRPTELKFVSRQTLWGDTLQAILYYALVQAVRAGEIKGNIISDDDGVPQLELPPVVNPDTGEMEERDLSFNVSFPPVLEHDVTTAVDSIVKAATLGGSAMAGTMDKRTVTRLLLTALGEDNIDELLDIIYPPDEEGDTNEEEEEPGSEPPEGAPTTDEDDLMPPEQEESFEEAVKELRDAIRSIMP